MRDAGLVRCGRGADAHAGATRQRLAHREKRRPSVIDSAFLEGRWSLVSGAYGLVGAGGLERPP